MYFKQKVLKFVEMFIAVSKMCWIKGNDDKRGKLRENTGFSTLK